MHAVYVFMATSVAAISANLIRQFCVLKLSIVSNVNMVCYNWNGEVVPEGKYFIPKSGDLCMECLCVDNTAQLCAVRLCAPPPTTCSHLKPTQDCCKFECLDEVMPADNAGHFRLMAILVCLLLLAVLVLFLIYRFRRKRIQLLLLHHYGVPFDRATRAESQTCSDNGDEYRRSFLTIPDRPPPYTIESPPSYCMNWQDGAVNGERPDLLRLSSTTSRCSSVPLLSAYDDTADLPRFVDASHPSSSLRHCSSLVRLPVA